MINYIPIESILIRLPSKVRESLGDNLVLSHALDLYRSSSFTNKFKINSLVLELKNYTCEIPIQVESINRVFRADEKQISFVCKDTEECADYFLNCNDCNLEKVVYKGNRNNLINYKYNNCENCSHTYTIDENRILTSSLKDEFLFIIYNEEILEDDKYLIIDDTDLINALVFYVTSVYYREESIKEPKYMSIQTDYLNKAEILFKKFKSKIKLSNLDPDNVNLITGTDTKNSRLTRVWNNRKQWKTI